METYFHTWNYIPTQCIDNGARLRSLGQAQKLFHIIYRAQSEVIQNFRHIF